MRRKISLAIAVGAVAAFALAPGVTASDGGSGTYTVRDRTYDFVLFNGGTTTWQYFYVVAPAGTTFVGGGTISESSPRCLVGMPDGDANEIECGPLGTLIAPLAHLGFTATVAAAVPCGTAFQLYVSSTGLPPFTRADDATDSQSCAAAAPHVVRPPTVAGTPVVGHTLKATAPVWSETPTRVSYRWQRCSRKSCVSIRGATALRLKLARTDRGRSVRIVATASVGGATLTSPSGRLAVR